jgi:hypothetical protein
MVSVFLSEFLDQVIARSFLTGLSAQKQNQFIFRQTPTPLSAYSFFPLPVCQR